MTRAAEHVWTDAEKRKILDMLADGYGYDDIGAEIGVSGPAVRAKHRYIMRNEKVSEAMAARHIRKALPQLFAARDIRAAALDRRDITAMFCGDPAPGYSALDRR